MLNKNKIRYYLGIGAQPTKKVHKLLEKFDFLPKMPVPYGSKYLYEKPAKPVPPEFYEKFRDAQGVDIDTPIREKLRRELNLLETQYTMEGNSYNNLRIGEVATTDIDSDDPDVIERNIKFEELKRRFEKHKKYSLDMLHGNDYRFNNYLRKMHKLAYKKEGGLDVEAYKNYLDNLLEFRKLQNVYRPDLKDNINKGWEELADINNHPEATHGIRARTAQYDIEYANTIKDKVERYNSMRKIFIDLLKDEIEIRDQYELNKTNRLDTQ